MSVEAEQLACIQHSERRRASCLCLTVGQVWALDVINTSISTLAAASCATKSLGFTSKVELVPSCIYIVEYTFIQQRSSVSVQIMEGMHSVLLT